MAVILKFFGVMGCHRDIAGGSPCLFQVSSSVTSPQLSSSSHLWLLEAVACNNGHHWTTALTGRPNQETVAYGFETPGELGVGRFSPNAFEY